MRHAEDELPPSSLRGRLCEVFFSALMTEMIDPLMRRLGDKAELSDPIFGGAAGLSPLKDRLVEWTRFLSDHDARYDRTITVVGALWLDAAFTPPWWVHLVWVPFAAGLTIGGLRLSKAWLIAQEYRHRAREGRIAE